MKSNYLFLLLILLLFSSAKVTYCGENLYNNLKFTENKGQWEDRVLYRTTLNNGVAFLEQNCMTFSLSEFRRKCKHDDLTPKNHKCEDESNTINNHAFRLKLLNTKEPNKITPNKKTSSYSNYYLGNDKSKWVSKAYSYDEVLYEDIYSNIDWKIYSQGSNIKHDFILHRGSKVEDISIFYEGIEKLSLKNENLVLSTSLGQLVEVKPYAYQIINGDSIKIDAKFVLNNRIITYKIGEYNKDYDLIIDPELIFSTYTGSFSDNWGFTATHDRMGNAYLGGIDEGNEYPVTVGAFQTTYGGGNWDISISKFSFDGINLIYSTYLGGSSSEMPHSLIVNEFDELIVFGTTGSINFPTSLNAFQGIFAGGDSVSYDGSINFAQGCDIFISKFSNDGSSLMGSTYVGGSKNDGLNFRNYYNANSVNYLGNDSLYSNYGDGARGELITDDMNNVYVGSCTFSNDFPTTPNSFNPNYIGKQDGVVFKLDYNLSNMLFSSYIGGSEDDAVFSIDTDDDYKLYVTGGTVSHNFPTSSSAYSSTFTGDNTDGFLTLISYNGDAILASTFFGSNKKDLSYFVRTDKYNNPHIFGTTFAAGTTLIHNASFSHPNSGQFVAKFTPYLDSLTWSTVFGSGIGRPNLSTSAFAVDICGRVYCTGWGGMGNLITSNMQTSPNAYKQNTDGGDFYIFSLNSDASSMDYATFFGANGIADHVDGGTSRYDKFSTIYQAACAGCGGSQSFPTHPTDVYGPSNNSTNCNAAIFKFNIHDDFAVADFQFPPIGCAPQTITFQNLGRGTSYFWDFGDGSFSNDTTPTHTFDTSGLYEVTLIAYYENGCVSSDTMKHTFLVLGNTSRVIDSIGTCPNSAIQIGIPPILNTDLTFYWSPENLITDPTISNPYAIIEETTDFVLIISDGVCSDTIYQRVYIHNLEISLPDSVHTCNSPIELTMNAQDYSSYKFSFSKDFSTLINSDTTNNSTLVYLTESGYVYIFVEKDGCIGFDSVWISFNGTSLSVQTTDISCFGNNDGQALAVYSGGISPHSLVWSNGETGVSTITGLAPNSYWVKVTESTGCHSTLPFTISTPDSLSYSVTKVNNPCNGVCIGQINITPIGGTAPYSILWHNGQNQFSISNLCSGNYVFTITDANNCEFTDTIIIINEANFITILTKKDLNCIEACKGEIMANVGGGTAPYSYIWSTGDTTQTITDLCVGDYNVQTTDTYGCKSSDTISIVNLDIFRDFEIQASKTEIYDGEVITLSVTQYPGLTYLWTPSTYIYNPNLARVIATPLQSITYQVFVTDGNGCDFTDSIRIKVEVINCGEPNIFIPNVFTPNSDGKNDVIMVSGEHIEKIKFIIFDRWGEEVFATTDKNKAWDGTFKGQDCLAGVYFYRLEIECGLGRTFKKSGDITLIR
ncbi:MAG: gliding motility-associated C-terminal domain-containing protein [Bacteroidales bacterium]|jgi:gliding motility-associated-like protein|nr:gliding motility-associated C-terminal domain-containing protein [Bacteroidales bacterium]MDX9798286.1 gliding motility-associated C-terminal domain-containing protein [Bacteroidales bacterium]